MTQEQICFFEDQVEQLSWYRQIMNVVLALESDELYGREDAAKHLTEVAQEIALTLGVRWKE